jgi:hypothetical protein
MAVKKVSSSPSMEAVVAEDWAREAPVGRESFFGVTTSWVMEEEDAVEGANLK